MKRYLVAALALLCLTGCAQEPRQSVCSPTASEEVTVPDVESTLPAPTETTEPTTQATEQERAHGYQQKIGRIDQVIYEGPGYDYSQVGNIGEIGTYTIIEECADAEGNLWGKLKSGLGWVDLTQIREEEADPPVITATYADLRLMEDREFEQFTVDNGEFSVKAAICAHKNIQNIKFYSMGLAEGEEDQLLFTLTACEAGSFFVIDLAFPGDLTAYSIQFADESGKDYHYVLTDSGRGGLWLDN